MGKVNVINKICYCLGGGISLKGLGKKKNTVPTSSHARGSSLVPRLPRSGTQTLKLCRRGEL